MFFRLPVLFQMINLIRLQTLKRTWHLVTSPKLGFTASIKDALRSTETPSAVRGITTTSIRITSDSLANFAGRDSR